MTGEEGELEGGELGGDVLLGLEEEKTLLANVLDEATAVVLYVALAEAVAVAALSVAVELGEAQRHVGTVDIVTAVGLRDGQDTSA